MSHVYAVVGGNKGLGLELVTQILASEEKALVVATARAPEKADELKSLERLHAGRLKIVKLDARNELSIKDAAQQVGSELPDGVDTLINNAGIVEPWSLSLDTSPEDFKDVLQVNSIGPFLAIREFLPLLKKKETRQIVNISSKIGSVKYHNDAIWNKERRMALQGYLAYAASKAALNMVTSVVANQLQPEGFTIIALHPGHVSTSLGARDVDIIGKAALTPQQSVEGQLKVIKGLTKQDTGKFLDWNGALVDY